MGKLKAILAVSADGYTAAHDADRMQWTGPDDKLVFRLYTHATPVLGVGAKTLAAMPKELPGRSLVPLSTTGLTLQKFAESVDDAFVIGGPRLVVEGLRSGIITTLILVRCPTRLSPPDDKPIGYYYTEYALQDAMAFGEGVWHRQPVTKVKSVSVEVYYHE